MSQDVHTDRKVHPRLIGAKGRSIKQIMNEYGVAIRFSKDEDIVTVTGAQDKVEECIEHILNLEEEYVSEEREIMLPCFTNLYHVTICAFEAHFFQVAEIN